MPAMGWLYKLNYPCHLTRDEPPDLPALRWWLSGLVIVCCSMVQQWVLRTAYRYIELLMLPIRNLHDRWFDTYTSPLEWRCYVLRMPV